VSGRRATTLGRPGMDQSPRLSDSSSLSKIGERFGRVSPAARLALIAWIRDLPCAAGQAGSICLVRRRCRAIDFLMAVTGSLQAGPPAQRCGRFLSAALAAACGSSWVSPDCEGFNRDSIRDLCAGRSLRPGAADLFQPGNERCHGSASRSDRQGFPHRTGVPQAWQSTVTGCVGQAGAIAVMVLDPVLCGGLRKRGVIHEPGAVLGSLAGLSSSC